MKFNDCCRPLLFKLMLTLNESSSFVCFLLLTLSSVSVLLANITDVVVCPPETAYTPCYCNEYSPGVLTLLGRNLGDSRISEILDAFLLNDNINGSSALGELELDLNQLTRVPDQIKYFPQLTLVSLDFNLITSLDSVAFNFTDAANPIRSWDWPVINWRQSLQEHFKVCYMIIINAIIITVFTKHSSTQ